MRRFLGGRRSTRASSSSSSTAAGAGCSSDAPMTVLASCPRIAATSIGDDSFWDSWQLSVVRHCDAHHQLLSDRHSLRSSDDCDASLLLLAHANEVDQLRARAADCEKRCREATSQRAIMESVISERLVSERAAVTGASDLRDELKTVRAQLAAVSEERNQHHEAMHHVKSLAEGWERRAKDLEVQLAEVESFLGGDGGAKVLQLEGELAEARLDLAEAESEKDELFLELEQLRAAAPREGLDGEEGDESEEHADDDAAIAARASESSQRAADFAGTPASAAATAARNEGAAPVMAKAPLRETSANVLRSMQRSPKPLRRRPSIDKSVAGTTFSGVENGAENIDYAWELMRADAGGR